MRTILCFAARGIIRDARSNNVSAFNILEQIVPVGFPVVIQEFSVLGSWAPDDPEDLAGPVELEFRLDLNGQVLVEQTVSLVFEPDRNHRHIGTIGGVVVSEPGQMRVGYYRDGEDVGSYSFRIKPAAPELFQDVEE